MEEKKKKQNLQEEKQVHLRKKRGILCEVKPAATFDEENQQNLSKHRKIFQVEFHTVRKASAEYSKYRNKQSTGVRVIFIFRKSFEGTESNVRIDNV